MIGVKKRYTLFPDADGDQHLEIEDHRAGSDGPIEIALFDGHTFTVSNELPTVHLSTSEAEELVELLKSILDQDAGSSSKPLADIHAEAKRKRDEEEAAVEQLVQARSKQESSTLGKQPTSTASNGYTEA